MQTEMAAQKNLTVNDSWPETDFTMSGRNNVMPIVPNAWSSQKTLNSQTFRLRNAADQPAWGEIGVADCSAAIV